MPVVDFDPKHKRQDYSDFPKLFLETRERARILVPESKPQYEWTHDMKAPQIVQGRVVMRTYKRRDGTETEVPEHDFIGRHICLGSLDVIEEKGIDPDNCSVCRESTNSDAVKAPERRFAMQVIRYVTKPGGFDVEEPLSVQCLGWSFKDGVFNKLVDIRREWGNLQEHDLLLGPCEAKQYQRFDIAASQRAVWLETEEAKKYVVEVWKANQSRDVTFLIGRRLTRDQVEDQLNQVLDRHRRAFGSAEDDPAVSEPTKGEVEFGDLVGAEPTDEKKAQSDEPEPAPTSTGATIDFDDLLS